jgi:hypothetical protein
VEFPNQVKGERAPGLKSRRLSGGGRLERKGPDNKSTAFPPIILTLKDPVSKKKQNKTKQKTR